MAIINGFLDQCGDFLLLPRVTAVANSVIFDMVVNLLYMVHVNQKIERIVCIILCVLNYE